MLVAGDLQRDQAVRYQIPPTMTELPTALDRAPRALDPAVCDSCDEGPGDLVFGNDSDGFVICRECHSPLFYCDLGGQG